MRRAELSLSRQTTSSRQSPKRSAQSPGVALVPLLEERPVGESWVRVLLICQFHFEIVVPSRSSRVRSPSHQQRKFIGPGRVETISLPLTSWRLAREDQPS